MMNRRDILSLIVSVTLNSVFCSSVNSMMSNMCGGIGSEVVHDLVKAASVAGSAPQ